VSSEIHEEHPFRTPEELRDPVRRFRGRLTAPVTIVTAGVADAPAGLTVSSLMVAEGDPARLYLLVGPATDLYEAIMDTGHFIVHVLSSRDRRLSDVFAGLRPSPGGPFAGLDLDQTRWGPTITSIEDRAFCTLNHVEEESFVAILAATIDDVSVAELADPLAYFRGSYRELG
jgi:flavin reductase (DIM6/NTAB) family NADH-FMN oxidoreductase RutF